MVVDEDALSAEIRGLVEEADALAAELGIESAAEEGSRTKALLSKLHAYNEVKDIAQSLLGRLATAEGCTTKALYVRFGLSLSD